MRNSTLMMHPAFYNAGTIQREITAQMWAQSRTRIPILTRTRIPILTRLRVPTPSRLPVPTPSSRLPVLQASRQEAARTSLPRVVTREVVLLAVIGTAASPAVPGQQTPKTSQANARTRAQRSLQTGVLPVSVMAVPWQLALARFRLPLTVVQISALLSRPFRQTPPAVGALSLPLLARANTKPR